MALKYIFYANWTTFNRETTIELKHLKKEQKTTNLRLGQSARQCPLL
jgi:hypothetical protein